MKLALLGFSDRNPLTEHQQLIWFCEQRTKTMNKRHKTAFYLDVYEFYFDRLIDAQAFEFVSFLMKQITEKQILNRLKWRKKQADKDIENLEKWKAWMRNQLFKEKFLNDYSPN